MDAAQVWARGDYPRIGEAIEAASIELARVAGLGPGDHVLDVGAGSGNTCIALARRGAQVTSVDLSDAWFDTVRRRAAAAGVEIDLVLGDVQDLPFEHGAFDGVTSCFAHIFAPDHQRAADEMARVLRPGGTLAVGVWTDGDLVDGFSTVSRNLPPVPDNAGTAAQWGDRDHLVATFRRAGLDVTDFHQGAIDWSFPSVQAVMDLLFTASGPWMASRDRLVELGRWPEVEQQMLEDLEQFNRRGDGTYGRVMTYLVATGTRAGT